jgi:biofilm PGA synthesis N-glycosyltransferase PgaC
VSYVVITPARDEAQELPRLAESLARQTVPPDLWLIVENGSTDGTLAVARALEAEHGWIRVTVAPPGPPRLRGAPVVRALHAGLDALGGDFDVVAKVDADVSFGAHYFERLLLAFTADADLGMASGDCWEADERGWRRRPVTDTHVWGAARAYRWECLQDVLPLDERMGWDGIDQIRAATRGWTVARVPDLTFHHHRREGERDQSRRRVWAAQGSAAHYMGYRLSYVLLRTLHRARHEPAAVAILPAYLAAVARREPRCPDEPVRRLLRRRQRARHLLQRAREAAPRSG